MNKTSTWILGALLVISAAVNVAEHKKLALFEKKFGSYDELAAAEEKAYRYAELRQYPVVVYIKNETTEDELLNWMESLRSFPDIEAIEYVSRDRAIEEFRSTHPCPITAMCADPRPGIRASLVVVVRDLSQRNNVAAFIKSHDPRSIIDEIKLP